MQSKKIIVRHPEYLFSKIKNIILYIYSFQCQLCGFISINNHVHHIDKNHKNNNPLNLTCLCANCHKIAHSAVKINISSQNPAVKIHLDYLCELLYNFDYKLKINQKIIKK